MKVAIFGAGNVGSSAAFALFCEQTASEIVLIDVLQDKVEGEAQDIMQGGWFKPGTKMTCGTEYSLADGSDIIVICAGSHRKGEETRLDLIHKNGKILLDIIKGVKHNKDAIIIVVSNPVDVLTYLALKESGMKENQVFGTGTILDTSRLRVFLEEKTGISPNSIQANVLGEHGDSSFVQWSKVNVAGQRLDEDIEITKRMQKAAHEIVRKKGATHYAIAIMISRLIKAIANDERAVFPLSTKVDDVCISVLCILGRNGIEKLPLELTPEEKKQFEHSADVIRKTIKDFEK